MDLNQEEIENAMKQQEREKMAEAERREIVAQVLTPPAMERLNRLRLVKPDLVERVERSVEQQARSRRLKGMIDEPEMIEILRKFGGGGSSSGGGGADGVTSIKVIRKKQFDEGDEDSDDDLR